MRHSRTFAHAHWALDAVNAFAMVLWTKCSVCFHRPFAQPIANFANFSFIHEKNKPNKTKKKIWLNAWEVWVPCEWMMDDFVFITYYARLLEDVRCSLAAFHSAIEIVERRLDHTKCDWIHCAKITFRVWKSANSVLFTEVVAIGLVCRSPPNTSGTIIPHYPRIQREKIGTPCVAQRRLPCGEQTKVDSSAPHFGFASFARAQEH